MDHQIRSILAALLGVAIGYILAKVTYQAVLLEALPQHVENYEWLFPIVGVAIGAIAMPIIVYLARGEVLVVGSGLTAAVASAVSFLVYAIFVPDRAPLLITIWLVTVFLVRFIYMLLKPRGKGLKS